MKWEGRRECTWEFVETIPAELLMKFHIEKTNAGRARKRKRKYKYFQSWVHLIHKMKLGTAIIRSFCKYVMVDLECRLVKKTNKNIKTVRLLMTNAIEINPKLIQILKSLRKWVKSLWSISHVLSAEFWTCQNWSLCQGRYHVYSLPQTFCLLVYF